MCHMQHAPVRGAACLVSLEDLTQVFTDDADHAACQLPHGNRKTSCRTPKSWTIVPVDPDLVFEPTHPKQKADAGMFDDDQENHEPSAHASEECDGRHLPKR